MMKKTERNYLHRLSCERTMKFKRYFQSNSNQVHENRCSIKFQNNYSILQKQTETNPSQQKSYEWKHDRRD